METKKHIINLPKNKVAENISVKTENDQIIVNYDLKEKLNLKEGEIYLVEPNIGNKFICIYDKIMNGELYSYASFFYNSCALFFNDTVADCYNHYIVSVRKAESHEKKRLFNALAKAGKHWNAEKMCVEDIFNPKDGDFLVNKTGKVFIYKTSIISEKACGKVCGCYCGVNTSDKFDCKRHEDWTGFNGCRYATESEKQAFLERLKDEGYTWNTEKKCLEEYVWKPKYGERFYYIHVDFKVYEGEFYDTLLNYNMINANNCFQTEEQAERKAKELREVLKKK